MAEDENIKKSKQAVDLLMLQNKAKEFQERSNNLLNKNYQGRVQGVTITMKGNHDIVEIHIDQSFYETAGKGELEIAFIKCLSNLNTAINNEQQELQNELQNEIIMMQKKQNEEY